MSSETYTAAANINLGDVVCLAGNNFPQPPLVRTATPDILATAPIVGVALAAAGGGQPVTVADAGGVQPSITGLPGGAQGPIAISGTGRCTAILVGAAWLIGETDRFGDLEIRPRPFEFLDVRSFGAVGDGSTDDCAAIQAAISAYGSMSGTLVFPVGTFRVASNLTFPANVELRFENGGQLRPGNTVTITINGRVTASPTSFIFANAQSGQGRIDMTAQDAVSVIWFGAVPDCTGPKSTPNDAAFQAALDSVGNQGNGAFGVANQSAAKVQVPPGNYRIQTGFVIRQGVIFEGLGGGVVWSSVQLQFDPGAGIDNSTNGRSCITVDRFPPYGPNQRADGARIRRIRMNQFGDGQFASNADPNNLIMSTAIRIRCPNVTLEDVSILNFAGNGIEFESPSGTLADDPSFVGTIVVLACGAHGLVLHDSDANTLNTAGALLQVQSNMGWGIYDRSFLGCHFGMIHTAENGINPYPTGPNPTVWQHGDYVYNQTLGDFYNKIWTANRIAHIGDLVLPTIGYESDPANRIASATDRLRRFIWRVQNAPEPGVTTFANKGGWNGSGEPDWKAVTVAGGAVADANRIVYVAWCEQGGSFARPSDHTGGISFISYLYAEADQARAILFNTALGGQTTDIGNLADPSALATHGQLVNSPVGPAQNLRSDFFTVRDDLPYPKTGQNTPIWIALGGARNFENTVLRIHADLTPDNPSLSPPWYSDIRNDFLDWQWNPTLRAHEWIYGQLVPVKSIASGRSLPEFGATMYSSIWLAPNFATDGAQDLAARLTAMYTVDTAARFPDFVDAAQAHGAYQPGHFVFNIPRNPGPTPVYPLGWRIVKKTGYETNTWSADRLIRAGDVIAPGTPGNSLFRARVSGTTGNTKPLFDDSGASFHDGTSSDPGAILPGAIFGQITWDWWGGAQRSDSLRTGRN
jgi:hypothetical protein